MPGRRVIPSCGVVGIHRAGDDIHDRFVEAGKYNIEDAGHALSGLPSQVDLVKIAVHEDDDDLPAIPGGWHPCGVMNDHTAFA